MFALNLTTALGLGLAIDYCLLMVARFREELAHGRPVDLALSHTVQTAGRTVLYSGATVAASLTALLVFPVPYLRSFAFAGVAVVVVACAASVVILPALLAWLGVRIGPKASDPTESFWGHQARRVTRHPAAWALSSPPSWSSPACRSSASTPAASTTGSSPSRTAPASPPTSSATTSRSATSTASG